MSEKELTKEDKEVLETLSKETGIPVEEIILPQPVEPEPEKPLTVLEAVKEMAKKDEPVDLETGDIKNVIQNNEEKPDVIELTEAGKERVKDARGRHPIPCDRGQDGRPCEKCKAKEINKPTIKDQLQKYKTVKTPNQTTTVTTTTGETKKIDTGKFVSGALFLVMIDNTIPALMLKLMAFVMDENYKLVPISEVKMNEEQRKDLEPFAKEAVTFVFGQMHPFWGFLLVCGWFYGGNILSLDMAKHKK